MHHTQGRHEHGQWNKYKTSNKLNNTEPHEEKQPHEQAQEAQLQMHISSSKCSFQAPEGDNQRKQKR